jgi:hypothetical protein
MGTVPSMEPQPQHMRLLIVGDNETFGKGSQGRAEEAEAPPVHGGAHGSPGVFTNLQGRVENSGFPVWSPANSVP